MYIPEIASYNGVAGIQEDPRSRDDQQEIVFCFSVDKPWTLDDDIDGDDPVILMVILLHASMRTNHGDGGDDIGEDGIGDDKLMIVMVIFLHASAWMILMVTMEMMTKTMIVCDDEGIEAAP